MLYWHALHFELLKARCPSKNARDARKLLSVDFELEVELFLRILPSFLPRIHHHHLCIRTTHLRGPMTPSHEVCGHAVVRLLAGQARVSRIMGVQLPIPNLLSMESPSGLPID